MGARGSERIPYVVEVEFRTASSFLVAYSMNLSRGGIFLETDHAIDVGAEISLRFAIPGADQVSLKGRVMWRRGEPAAPEQLPRGLGIQFQDMDDTMGSLIDRLVAEYAGVRVLLVSGREQDASVVTGLVRAVLSTAEITSVFDVPTATEALGGETDVAIIVADEPFALEILHLAKYRSRPVPIVALTASRRSGQHVRSIGADEVVDFPPAFSDFQSALVRALGRPMAVR